MAEIFHVIGEVLLPAPHIEDTVPRTVITHINHWVNIPFKVISGPETIAYNTPTLFTIELPVVDHLYKDHYRGDGVRYSDAFGPGIVRVDDRFPLYANNKWIGLYDVKRVVPVGMPIDDLYVWAKFDKQIVDAHLLGEIDIICPTCNTRFSILDRHTWTGVRHRLCGQRINIVEIENQIEPLWCMVGNIVEDHPYGEGGAEIRHGTKHFARGTKVYCFPPLWGDGYQNIKVVGLARRPRKYIMVVIRSAWVTNRRAKLIYEPEIVDRLSGYWDGSERSKQLAEDLAAIRE